MPLFFTIRSRIPRFVHLEHHVVLGAFRLAVIGTIRTWIRILHFSPQRGAELWWLRLGNSNGKITAAAPQGLRLPPSAFRGFVFDILKMKSFENQPLSGFVYARSHSGKFFDRPKMTLAPHGAPQLDDSII